MFVNYFKVLDFRYYKEKIWIFECLNSIKVNF